ncbi:hypothetical protein MKW98_015186 [Papaver atlanticum]|uniref:Uncharacterized protein n=1 Tax=Papaver atlanticum TaxID=357466 RepID=A0AAD4XSF2_9MAGN|nr:hypothetical protein MKW98_015186 [Papaver atlanticum]
MKTLPTFHFLTITSASVYKLVIYSEKWVLLLPNLLQRVLGGFYSSKIGFGYAQPIVTSVITTIEAAGVVVVQITGGITGYHFVPGYRHNPS